MDLSVNLQQLWSITSDRTQIAHEIYEIVMWWRRSIIIISSSLLLINIVMIIKSKQYIYNTLKLFLFVEVFTLVGQLCVLPHNSSFQGGRQFYFQDTQSINDIIKQMLSDSYASMIPCTLQAYINLFCYNISYLFALLITLYVRRVIDNQHKYFMQKHYKIILYACILTILVYLPPFVLAFFNDVPYSFGPVGFQIKSQLISDQTGTGQYLFYCGITSRSNQFYASFLSVFNMMIIPVLMFILHSILLRKNRKSMKFLRGLAQLNPRQWFILKSGTLSVFIFVFQSINFIKYALSLINSDSSVLIVIIAVLNLTFDLLPIILVWFYYKKYYRRGKKLQQNSLVRTINDQSIVTNEIMAY